MASGLLDSLLETVQSLSQMDREQKQQKSMDAYRKEEVGLRKQEIEAQRQHATAVQKNTEFMQQFKLDQLAETIQRDRSGAAQRAADATDRNERAAQTDARIRELRGDTDALKTQFHGDAEKGKAAALAEQKRVNDVRIPKIIAEHELVHVKTNLLKDTADLDKEWKTSRNALEISRKVEADTHVKNLKADLALKGIKVDHDRFKLALEKQFAVPAAELDHQIKQITLQIKQRDVNGVPNAQKHYSWVKTLWEKADSDYFRVFQDRRTELDRQGKLKATVDVLSKQDLSSPERAADKFHLEHAKSELDKLNPRIQLLHGEVKGYDDQRKGYQAELDKAYGLTHTNLTGTGEAEKKQKPRSVEPMKVGGKNDLKVPSLKKASAADWDRIAIQAGGDRIKMKLLAAKEGLW